MRGGLTRTRRNRVLLGVLVVAGLVRVGVWVLVLEVPSPIDEVQHVAYVDSLVNELRPPVTGRDVIPEQMASLAKDSPTFTMRTRPVTEDPRDPGWGANGASYQGGQTPLGYAPYVPVWAVAQHLPPVWGLFSLRVVAALVAVLPLPLLVLAGRRLFPDRPAIGWAAAVTYLALPSVWGHSAIPAGDALVPTAGLLALLALTTVGSRQADRRSAILVGLATSGLLLVKPTTLGVAPLVALVGAGMALARLPWRRWLGWAGTAATAAFVPLVPWFVWNWLAYGALSGSEANDAILGDWQFDVPFGWEALVLHTRSALGGLFGVSRGERPWDPTDLAWLALLLVTTVAGTVVAWRSHRRREALTLPALALTLPFAYLGMLVVIFVVFGGRSSVVGRHLVVAMPMVCLAIAAGAVLAAGRRWGPVLLLVVAASVLLPREALVLERFVDDWYLRDVPDAVLAVQDDRAITTAAVDAVTVTASCPITHVDLVTDDAPLGVVETPTGALLATVEHDPILPATWVRVELPTPRREITLGLPGDPTLPVTADGEAAHRLWCVPTTTSPEAAAWAARRPLHPVPLSWDALRAWVWLLRWGLPAAALAAAAGLAWPRDRLR